MILFYNLQHKHTQFQIWHLNFLTAPSITQLSASSLSLNSTTLVVPAAT